jgi:hypothetical protein
VITTEEFMARHGVAPTVYLWPETETLCPFCGKERGFFAIPTETIAKILAGRATRLVTCGSDPCLKNQKRIVSEIARGER